MTKLIPDFVSKLFKKQEHYIDDQFPNPAVSIQCTKNMNAVKIFDNPEFDSKLFKKEDQLLKEHKKRYFEYMEACVKSYDAFNKRIKKLKPNPYMTKWFPFSDKEIGYQYPMSNVVEAKDPEFAGECVYENNKVYDCPAGFSMTSSSNNVCVGYNAASLMLTNNEFYLESQVLAITNLTSKRRKTLESANKFPMRLTVCGGDVIYGHCYFGEDIRKWYEHKQATKRKPRSKK